MASPSDLSKATGRKSDRRTQVTSKGSYTRNGSLVRNSGCTAYAAEEGTRDGMTRLVVYCKQPVG